MKKNVLFLCTHNSARSQMAEGLLRFYHGGGFDVDSAGIVHTLVKEQAVRVMEEIGIDLSGHRSKSVEEFRGRSFDYVVTVCDSAREACPFFPGKHVLHKEFNDPSDIQGTDSEKLEGFRKTRDEIRAWLESEFIPLVKGGLQ